MDVQAAMKQWFFFATVVITGATLLATMGNTVQNSDNDHAARQRVRQLVQKGDLNVRLFYVPREGDFAPYPMIFRMVPSSDSRKGTAKSDRRFGHTAFLTESDLTGIVGILFELNLEWKVSSRPINFDLGPTPTPPYDPRGMRVEMTGSAGSISAFLPADMVCKTLPRLDSVLPKMEVFCEYLRFRAGIACDVPDYDKKCAGSPAQ